ncbi:MAG: hypothetical protein FVQ83_11870 [Chloroflexi bacterium]|nr:hypothetical protein [Chloroflexota bacterium]
MDTTILYAQEQDRQDPIAAYRERFVFPEADLIYMDGNSLGRLPGKSVQLAEDLVNRQWGEGWWGQKRPFDFGLDYIPESGAEFSGGNTADDFIVFD